MGVDSGAYDIVMVLHVMCVIVGFGTVFLNGIYGVESKRRPGREGLAIFEATERVGRVAEGFILAVPVFGIALVLMSHREWRFSQAWIATALGAYAVGIALSFGFHLPNLRRMGVLMHELVVLSEKMPVAVGAGQTEAGSAGGPPPQVAELELRGQRAGIYGGALNLIILFVVILMVWKPGS